MEASPKTKQPSPQPQLRVVSEGARRSNFAVLLGKKTRPSAGRDCGAGLWGGVLLELPIVPSPAIIVVAFIFLAQIWTGFGYIPARCAERLNPIEALRRQYRKG